MKTPNPASSEVNGGNLPRDVHLTYVPVVHRADADVLVDANPVDSRDGVTAVLGGQREFQEDSAVALLTAGELLGSYRLERPLGRGGMSEVWLAVLDGMEPNVKAVTLSTGARVALKIPFASMLAGALRGRFERERVILSALNHPNIARLYEAGVAQQGMPYLAMEFVHGQIITQYCDLHRLDLPSRLHLFIQVLEAVGHAHARLVLHRDLKPSNVLVDQLGAVKLLDFGIAKLLRPDGPTPDGEVTRLVGSPMTRVYAAPEQITGRPLTTAADIYSLGVLLYELLTGQRPCEDATTRGEHVPLPSFAVSAEFSASVGGLRRKQLAAHLRGDLDAILDTALALNPDARYRSALAFADDLQRHLDQRPISVRHLSAWGVAWKFFKRHATISIFATATFASSLVGVALMEWQREQALQQLEHAQAAQRFLKGMFVAHNSSAQQTAPNRPLDERTSAKSMLDASVPNIESILNADPTALIDMLSVTSDIYLALGEPDRYEKLHQRAIQLAQARYGILDVRAIDGLIGDIDKAYVDGNNANAERLISLADQRINQAGLNHSAMRGLWWLYRSRLLARGALKLPIGGRELQLNHAGQLREAAAAASLQHSVAIFARYAPESANYPMALAELSDQYADAGDEKSAIKILQKALDSYHLIDWPDDAERIAIYERLALALQNSGRVDEAKAAYQNASKVANQTYGKNNRLYWFVAAQYARLIHSLGDWQAADNLFLALLNELPKPQAPEQDALMRSAASFARQLYGRHLTTEGRPELALPVLQDAFVELPVEDLGDSDHRDVLLDWVDALDHSGHLDQAEEHLAQLVVTLERTDLSTTEYLTIHQRCAQHWLLRNDLSRAQACLQAAINRLDGVKKIPPIAVPVMIQAIQLALASGESDLAIRYAEHGQALAAKITRLQDVRNQFRLKLAHAHALHATGKFGEAHDLANEAVAGLARFDHPQAPELIQAQAFLRQLEAAKI